MKNKIWKSIGAALFTATFLTGNLSFAQTQRVEATTTTTTSAGTISEFGPDRLIIKTESSPDPLRYTYSKTTIYVDENGAPVAREMIRPGAPVTVHYVREGDNLLANRVIVHKTTTTTTEPGRQLTKKEAKEQRDAREHPEREARRAAKDGKPFPPANPSEPKTTITTTTTTSDGTVSSFSPEQVVIRSTTSEGPMTYRYSKTTQYIDDSGAPVTVEVVKSGVPVTVSYVREGDGYIAQRVIVHTRPAASP